MSSNLALVSAGAPKQLITATHSIQLEQSNIPFNFLHPFYLDDERQIKASQAAHPLFDIPAASMDRQQTEHISNVANVEFYDVQPQLLQGYYFDGNPKSEVISSSETACTAGVRWLLNADSGTAAHEYIHVNDLGRDTVINIAEGNINSLQDYLGLTNTEISKNRDFCSSGKGASVSNEIIQLINLHGRQPSEGAQQFDSTACRIPNVPSAVYEYLGNCHKGDRKYFANVTGCSSNPQDWLTPPNIYQTSLDFPSSYQRLEGVSLDQLHCINATPDQQMWQSSKNIGLDDCSYARSEYSSVGRLRCSKYLREAQRLLEEVCYVKLTCNDHSITKRAPHSSIQGVAAGALHFKRSCSDYPSHKQSMKASEELLNLQMRKALLIAMVEQLDRAYQQYQEQMQLIITSLESATGIDAAAPYTALAKKLISRRFRALRDAIGEHIHDTCSILGDDISSVPILNKGETPRLRILDQRLRHHRTLQQVSMLPQVWRPPRGLPDRSVAVLRAWLFEHFLHPYPKDSEKLMLARLTGLTRNQVANWFINARVRLWKPMVEQMYAEEKKEAELQNQAGAEQQYEQISITEYGSSCGFKGNNVMALERRENPPKRHRYEHLVDEECNSRTMHSSIMTKHGVSLTLALQHSSSDKLAPNIYQHYFEHPLSGDADYNITHGVFS